jgi:hypothetical protein
MNLTDILAGIALVEAVVYGAKGTIYALKYYKNADDRPDKHAKTFCGLPLPIDSAYLLYSAFSL